MDFYVFLPQMRMSMGDIVERARAAEQVGFVGMTGMDHLTPPMADHTSMFEAMITNTWIAAHTERLRVGSLVLCDSFRHPSILAREAVSLDHASRGRFDLGLGWGSIPEEMATFGIGTTDARARLGRMKETIEILTALWTGESVDYDGEHFSLRGARQAPPPLGRIPLVIGGAGRKTMELVAAHADWWNVHVGIVDRLDEMRSFAGKARVSLQVQVAFVPSEDRRDDVTATARRRFGERPVVGSAGQLVDYFGSLRDRGVERFYVWFCDFGPAETLTAFGEQVVAQLA